MKKLNTRTKKWMQIVLALLLFVGFVSNAFKGGDNVTGALIGAVLCLVWAVVVYCKHIKGPRNAPAPDVSVSPHYEFVSFNVAGTTFDTDGVSRQALLRKIKFGDAPFENSDSLEVSLRHSTYEGSPCIECRVNDVLIGYVPKAKIDDVMQILGKKGATISAFDVQGGGEVNGECINFGALVVVRAESAPIAHKRSTASAKPVASIGQAHAQNSTKPMSHDVIVHVTKNGNTYHSSWTCQHLSGKKSIAIKRSEAQQQNYKPCKKCYPYQ